MSIREAVERLAVLALLAPSVSVAGDPAEIMRQVHERHVGDDSESTLVLDYTPASGAEREITLEVRRKDFGDDSKTLMRYVAPSFMAGSGLLVHSFNDREDRQWLYLSRSASREPRRIPSSQKDERLFGTDFYYIDLEDKITDSYSYRLLESGDDDLVVIESVPNDDDYPYDRTVSTVDTTRDMEVGVEYYVNGELHKSMEVLETELIDDIWTATRVHMENHEEGTTTLMTVREIQYNVGVGDYRFTFSELTGR